MDAKEMITELEDILDVEEGTLELTTKLSELEEWDSVSKLSVVIFLDEEFGKKATGDDVAKFETVKDIVENPKNLEVVELVAQQLPLSLADAEIAVINNGVAVQANLSPLNDSIYIENTESESVVNYYNIIAARTEDKDNPTLKRLVEVYQTEETKKAIEEEYKGASIPVFE